MKLIELLNNGVRFIFNSASGTARTYQMPESDVIVGGNDARLSDARMPLRPTLPVINHCQNPGAEVDLTGWVTYADAAASSPVDGTGGSPTLSLTRTTVNLQRGAGTFYITKDAANRQGEGFSYDFTIDRVDRFEWITVSFEISDAVGLTDGDLVCFVYDKTNAALRTIGGSGSVRTSGRHSFSFLATSSTSYRLIFHVATTVATAWTVALDTVAIGPVPVAKYPVVHVEAYDTTAQVLTANSTDLQYATEDIDTHGAWSGTIFTAPFPGIYMIRWGMGNAGASSDSKLYKNGSVYILSANSAGSVYYSFSCAVVYLAKNDTLKIRAATSYTRSAAAETNRISITKIGEL